jgi:hypothetical protein
VPNIIWPYLRIGTNWAVFLSYVPTIFGVLLQSAVLLIGGRSIRDMYALLGLEFPQIIPVWLFVAIGLCVASLCVGPLVVWFAYAKRYLSWAKFILAWGGTYLLPLATMAVLALICYEMEMRWTTRMVKQWLPPSP